VHSGMRIMTRRPYPFFLLQSQSGYDAYDGFQSLLSLLPCRIPPPDGMSASNSRTRANITDKYTRPAAYILSRLGLNQSFTSKMGSRR